jgi:hypothetical protein
MHSDWNVWTLLVSLWVLGSGVLVFRWLLQWFYLSAMVKVASPVDIDAPLPVRETTSTLEPGLFGIFSPTLVLPAGIAKHLSPVELDSILAHELCHWQRRDNLTAALHMLVETLFWFHPLVWWLGGKLVVERERACDEAVIQFGSDRHVYAEVHRGEGAMENAGGREEGSPESKRSQAQPGGIQHQGQRLSADCRRAVRPWRVDDPVFWIARGLRQG